MVVAPRIVALIGSKWTILIISELMKGSTRFGRLHAALPGISAVTLTERLRHLEAEGLVTRRPYHEMPPRVEYSLTSKGKGFRPILEAMGEFERTWGYLEPDAGLQRQSQA